MNGILLSLLTSLTVQAHVEPGVYKGIKDDGKECSMIAGKQYFERNTPHPLNERIPVTVDGQEFAVGHPPLIDSKEKIVFFNHDLFQGLLPNAAGANAVEIAMEHSESFEGPRSFVLMQHNWKTKERLSYRCMDLKLVK